MPTKDIPESDPDRPITRQNGKLLTIHDHVRSHVLETFGEESKATHWLNRPNHLFSGRTPAEVLETEPETVERELVRIDHGIFA